MKETDKATQRRNWETYYRSPLSNKTTVPTTMNHGTSRVDEESSEGNNKAHNEANGQLKTLLINPSNNSQAERASEVTPSENLNITLEQVELWIKACKELRQSQEKVLQKTLVGSGEDPSFWGLKTNILVSLLYVSETHKITKVGNSLHDAPLTLNFFLDASLHKSSTNMYSSFPNSTTNPKSTSPRIRLAIEIQQQTRWTLSKIEQQTQTQRKIAKRTRMLCSTLLLREQRLTYLLRQIKVRESPCEVDDAILAFAPDLELLNMERFLQDPAERSEVFRTELEALRQVLIVFQAEL
ncbi:hypothetical protein BGX20_000415 [Mortierella sp. AD010]|nr:hypothetical protein BGX20_000415 [Mortierella sp. AD010]